MDFPVNYMRMAVKIKRKQTDTMARSAFPLKSGIYPFAASVKILTHRSIPRFPAFMYRS